MKVVIVQRILPHYRVPFFTKLHEILNSQGIELTLFVGDELPGQVPKSVALDEPWVIRINNRYLSLFGTELVWQPLPGSIVKYDLVIVEQANRLLVNYILICLSSLFRFKLAFWGHGKNFQANDSKKLLEKWKQQVSVHVDWWFTYTRKSAEIVAATGFPSSRITSVNNSIDTLALTEAKDRISDTELEALRLSRGLTGENIAIYCGGMYPDKKIPFLLTACERIRSRIGNFEVLFIGDGPDSESVQQFAERHQWAHYLGSLTGDDKVAYFKLAKVQLLPGLVGLAVLDSFTLGVPMITTDLPIHSPEFDYIQDGYNGVVTTFAVDAYSNQAIRVLEDETWHSKLVEGCLQSATRYSVDNMAINFSEGVRLAITEPSA